jgi:signal transduction histidine kinase
VTGRLAAVRVRVTIVAAAVVAAALVVGAISLVMLVQAGLVRSLAGTAPQRAAELAALAARAPLPAALPPVDAARRTLLQVVAPDGHVVAASEALQGATAVLPPTARQRRIVDDLDAAGSGSWLAEPTPATIGAHPATVIVLTSLTEMNRTTSILEHLLIVAVPLLTAFAAIIIWVVVGRSLHPVEAMRAEVADITANELHRRVPVPATHDELARLAGTLNELLDRLEAASAAQRRFVADASHELRTPTANIRTAVEVATARPENADWGEVSADILRQGERLERLSRQLLALARSDASTDRSYEPVDLTALVAAEAARPVPRGKSLDTGDLAPVIVDGDPDQLASVMSNLIENGLRHARRRVTVSLRRTGSIAELTVADDGPGIPAEERERVFERFVRLDEHRNRSDGGTGLGLPIARAIVAAHGGSIAIAETSAGATFVVRIPLSASVIDRARH